MKKILVAAIAAMTMGASAFAGGDIAPIVVQEPVDTAKNFYVGVGITGLTTYVDGEKDFTNDTENSEISGGLEVKAGYVFYRTGAVSVAVEAQAGRSVWGFGVEDNTDLYTYDYAAFVKPAYAIGDASIYALLGYAKSGITDGDFTIQENGFAYGLGAEYAFTDTVAVYVDYTMLPAFTEDGSEDINNDKVALGVNYRF